MTFTKNRSFYKSFNKNITAEVLLAIFLLNIAILVTSFPNGTTNTAQQLNDQKLPSNLPQAISPQVHQTVANTLARFIGGFSVQGIQGDPSILYFIQSPTMSVGFGTNIVKMLFEDNSQKTSVSYTETTLTFPNSLTSQPIASQPISSPAQYYIGSSTTNSKQEYSTITYKNLYKHIDLVYTIKNGALKYNFNVYPGGNPQDIQMLWSGSVTVQQIAQGMQLTVTTAQGLKTIVDQNPVSIQSGASNKITSNFRQINGQSYGFKISNYDTNTLLVIDPSFLVYSTYFGGSIDDVGNDIAVDTSGNIYVTGYTTSSDFPTLNAFQGTNSTNGDAFVFKLDANGSLLYSTYIGGSQYDQANAIAVDGAGNAYITGYTVSTNFPTTTNAYSNTYAGGTSDVFIVKISPIGQLLYSTYLGGAYSDSGLGIAVDNNGSYYITGYTFSGNFPILNGNGTFSGGPMIFVSKFSYTNMLIYSTFLGGSGKDLGSSIAVDRSGNAYITGWTSSTNFPTLNWYQQTYQGGAFDAIVAKFSATGSLLYSTYLGGPGLDVGKSIAVTSNGNAIVVGVTESTTGFPTIHPYQASFGGGSYDAFVTTFSPNGIAVYSTYLGGSSGDQGYGVALDSSGNYFVVGYTMSTNFPILNAYQNTLNGNNAYDAFVSEFSPANSLLASTYIGGSFSDYGDAVAVGPQDNVYLTGYTNSNNYPTLNATQSSYKGGYDTIVSHFLFQSSSTLTPSSVITSVINPSATKPNLELSWVSPSVSEYFSHYTIYRATGSGSYSLLGTSTSPRYIDSTASSNVTYNYIISADYSFGDFNTTSITGTITAPITSTTTVSTTVTNQIGGTNSATTTSSKSKASPGFELTGVILLMAVSGVVILNNRRKNS